MNVKKSIEVIFTTIFIIIILATIIIGNVFLIRDYIRIRKATDYYENYANETPKYDDYIYCPYCGERLR